MIDQIEALYHERKAILGIVGMGYVGLPLMLAASAAGYCVIGFDVDPQKVGKINAGESYLKHIDSEQIAAASRKKRLRATTRFEEMKEVDAIIICVPTPLTPNREPDLTFIEAHGRINSAVPAKRSPGSAGIDHLAGHHKRSC